MFRLIRGLIALAILIVGAVFTYPMWYSPVVHALPAAGLFLPQPAGYVPSPLPTVIPVLPEQSSSAATGTAPISLATAPPIAPAPPVATVAPAPSTVTQVTWTFSDCRWATGWMWYDHDLDAAETEALENGSDTRYPRSDAAVYQQWADRWMTVVTQIQQICNNSSDPSPSATALSVAWFTEAIGDHEADLKSGANTAWDEQWIGIYALFTHLFQCLGQQGASATCAQ